MLITTVVKGEKMRDKKRQQKKNKEELAIASDHILRYFSSYFPYCFGWFCFPYNWTPFYYEPERHIDDVHSHEYMEHREEKENKK